MDLHWQPATTLARLIRQKKLSPVELLSAIFDRIDKLNPRLNAYVTLHVGPDGGGSIRIPASFAGIYGFKASYGRIPTYPVSGAWSLSHVGPMTRTVADAALMLGVCAGPDERDPYSLPAERVDYVKALGGSVKGWRAARTDDPGFADCVDPQGSAGCARAARAV